jgi:muconolactone delta-isomerase
MMMEFLVHMAVVRIDAGDEREKQLRQEEAARSRELATQGIGALLNVAKING